MGAGKPDYARLHSLGRLPKGMESMVPGLAEASTANAELERIKNGLCDDCRANLLSTETGLDGKCGVEGCEYVAKGSNAQIESRLRLHRRSHEVKKEE